MTKPTDYLLAARECEIAELEGLARTSELVWLVSSLVHALQRERGLSNVFLASGRTRFALQRLAQIDECTTSEHAARKAFGRMHRTTESTRNGARLLCRVAVAVHGLDQLTALRKRVALLDIAAADATAAFSRLIAGLLGVVFEAADAAGDPEISRMLVAMFNFMQGKEYAGQERALGAAVFAAGAVDGQAQQRWHHLIDAQQGCLDVFAEFATQDLLSAHQAGQKAKVVDDIERLRRIGCAVAAGQLDRDLSQDWYLCCTRRIDGMRSIEALMARKLRTLCESKVIRTRMQLRDDQALVHVLDAAAAGGAAAELGPQLQRDVLTMLQQQSRRLQAMSHELDTARAALNERKLVERAKGVLMARWNMAEDEAYRALRSMAMNQGRRLVDVACSVLSMSDVLPQVER